MGTTTQLRQSHHHWVCCAPVFSMELQNSSAFNARARTCLNEALLIPVSSTHAVPEPGVKLTSHLHLVSRSRMLEYASTPPYIFMVQCLFRHKDNFTFTFMPNQSCTLTKYFHISCILRTVSLS